ncbi:hypothetical protein ABZ348_15475 [Streptomyces sp. NPDC005963]
MGANGQIEEANGYDLGANETIVPVDPPAEDTNDEDSDGDGR